MANRLDDFFLPWQNRRKELKILALGLALFFLFSLGFFPCFFNERAALIERGIHDAATARLLDPSIAYRSMPPFWTMARGFLMGFLYYAVAALLDGIPAAYWSCRKGARADYTLRRLSDPWEYHRRCLVPPLFYAVIFLAVFALLTGIYYCIYLNMTPVEWLLPAGQRFWG